MVEGKSHSGSTWIWIMFQIQRSVATRSVQRSIITPSNETRTFGWWMCPGVLKTSGISDKISAYRRCNKAAPDHDMGYLILFSPVSSDIAHDLCA